MGVKLNNLGEVVIPWEKWDCWLLNIKKAPLKPYQKIDALRTTVLPKMIHQLRLADVGICKLKKLNTRIKIWFKQVMHIAEWTPDSWLNNEDGGNLANICELILKCRKKAAERMASSEDEVTAQVGVSVDDNARKNLLRLNKQHIETRSLKTHWRNKRNQELGKTLNGQALVAMTKSEVKRGWLWKDRFLDGRIRTRMCQMLSGTIPTRINITRGLKVRGHPQIM